MSGRAIAIGIVFLLLCGSAGCDRRIDTEFGHAVKQGDFLRAQEFLERGANVNARFITSDGLTPLMGVVDDNWNPEAIRFLLDHGADPDVRTFDGRTALFVAAFHGRAKHVHMLLEAGADLNACTRWGETALGIAHRKGHKVTENMIRRAGGEY